MGDIDIVSASAGSGKTHTLTTRLKDRLVHEKARPEAVLATTFTNRAAAELMERVRTALLAADRPRDAQVLTAARVGTVNSVCSRLLAEFCFELGMSPDQMVLDEVQADTALRRAVSGVVSVDEASELERLRQGWPALDWQDVVKEIVDKARANGIAGEDLGDCAERSAESYADLFGARATDGDALVADLRSRLEEFVERVDSTSDTTKTTRKTVQLARRFLVTLRDRGELAWPDWLRLVSAKTAKASADLYEPVRAAADEVHRHPRLVAEGRQIITMVFSIAARSLRAYDNHKLENGLVDFVDQEVRALELLARKEAQERIGPGTDLVLVDEFQDTSPLQLAIFLRLAELSPESFWVGDQKQAIYGFRGTDARLMDAAIQDILGGREPRTLTRSWRSRPELTRLTSAVFARAFTGHGIRARSVRLEPACEEEPRSLGPCVERWIWDYKGRESGKKNAAFIAAGIRDLLSDPESRVRASKEEPARKAEPGDVAVLCRTNAECSQVARALVSAGVRAAIPRAGLMQTLEAEVVVAGLQLWADPEDRLAAAKLVKLIQLPGEPEDWLGRVLAAGEDRQPVESQIVNVVRWAREADPLAGPLTAFDRVQEAVEARELCLSWGDASERLANLDALRAHVVSYLKTQGAGGGQGTVAGLLAWLEVLAAEDLDAQATVTDRLAVVVTTWHKSKGLEWPVVVLNSLASGPRGSALGVNVATDSDGFDARRPLAGRWIRFWPRPFKGQQTRNRFFQDLATHPEQVHAAEVEERERLRLLYVTWTRARDRLVLPARPGGFQDGILSLLQDEDGALIADVPASSTSGQVVRTEWAGTSFDLLVRVPQPVDPVSSEPEPGEDVDPRGSLDHPPASINPSSRTATGEIVGQERIGDSVEPRVSDELREKLGEAVHGFFAADVAGLDNDTRHAIAEGLLRRWRVGRVLAPGDVVRASDNLVRWVDSRWPGAAWHREVPVLHELESGSVVRGYCDLVLETEAGWVIVDHKTFVGTDAEARDKAGSFGGQLGAYADAIEATGRPIAGRWVHLALMGVVMEVE